MVEWALSIHERPDRTFWAKIGHVAVDGMEWVEQDDWETFTMNTVETRRKVDVLFKVAGGSYLGTAYVQIFVDRDGGDQDMYAGERGGLFMWRMIDWNTSKDVDGPEKIELEKTEEDCRED